MAGKASIGKRIKWIDQKSSKELEGDVSKIYENSVLVNISNSPIDMHETTVVSHKRYQIVS